VVAAGSPTEFAVTIWQLLGRLSMPVVGIHCGLFNYDFVRLQKRVTRALLQRSWAVLFGHAEYDPMCYLSDAPERIRVVECGTDVEFWSPGPATQGDYVFAIGNDGRRDFDGLLRAATGLDIPVKLVTSISPGVPIPANVEIVRGDLRKELLSDEQIRELYRNAKCVVVPLKETLQPSGQSVCLQAMACGRPVIMSDISGVWSRSRLRDGENIRLVPVGDDVALRGAIVELWNDQGLADRIAKCGLDTVRDVWNMQDYATGILRACEQAVRESRISQ
jgi:glycosyltransferase involved in cell wall biosynthesis